MSSPTATRPARAPRRRLGVGAVVVLVVAIAAASVVIGMIRGAGDAAARPDVDTIAVDEAQLPTVYVHVFGAVANPGLYRLDEGARVVDVIAAAGGLTPEADENAMNLARPLSDGEQLQVPAIGETPTGVPVDAGDGRVNLNTADVAALDTLPRVGPAIAQRIIDWRESNGRFTSVEDLLSVPGIGEKMLAGLRDLVTV
ncbi:ComEA family DNA-binding protein [Microbacterium sp.]|uniref:ComEA family DNA-binding protein n=1 Tax=Microbacterium sp. TaxID=51671 RepID=UPI002897A4CB|nr:ComEA family DNA-binding protein [Microbacterium sp.]